MREIRMLRTTWRKLETGLRDGLRHRKMAKASGQLRLPVPVATAPAFDPTLGEEVSAMAPPYPAKGLLVTAQGPELSELTAAPALFHPSLPPKRGSE